jgi:hypothetical protein
MSDKEKDQCEEIDLESTPMSVSADWPPRIGDPNSLLIPQQLSNLSRSNSMSSIDYQKIDTHDGDTH